MPTDSFINYLEAQHPIDILRRLLGHKIENPDQNLLVEVYLSSGLSLRGNILKLNEASRETCSLILSSDDNNSDLIYVLAQEIMAVRIFRAALYKGALSFGNYPTALDQARITNLESKRKIAQLKYPVSFEIKWEQFAGNELAPGAILMMAQKLEKALSEIASDSLGQTALAKLGKIEIRPSTDETSFLILNNGLVVSFNINKPIPDLNRIVQDISAII